MSSYSWTGAPFRAVLGGSRAGRAAAVIAALVLASCASPQTGGDAAPSSAPLAGTATQQRTLVAAVRLEPSTLALRPLRETFASPYLINRTFNADIAVLDDQASPIFRTC